MFWRLQWRACSHRWIWCSTILMLGSEHWALRLFKQVRSKAQKVLMRVNAQSLNSANFKPV